jgi:hypothetical protein
MTHKLTPRSTVEAKLDLLKEAAIEYESALDASKIRVCIGYYARCDELFKAATEYGRAVKEKKGRGE